MSPPPPPPGPPPPPTMPAMVLGGSSGADGRGMLLQSIRQGAKLKKVETVDKSAPMIPGKVTGSSGPASPRGGSAAKSTGSGIVVPNGLGGLFAGGIPKLKSTGRNLGADGPPPPQSSTPTPSPPPPPSEAPRRPFPGDVKSRGPPPQPPPANQKPAGIATSTSDSVLTERSQRAAPVLPNKPPVGGYGKPNVAPKPPGMAPNPPSAAPNTSQNKPSPPLKKVANGGPRPAVSRAHSMRVPRSPPVAPPTGPVFPTSAASQGDLSRSGPPSFHQSQDSLHYKGSNPPPPPRTATLPSSFHKPTAPAPPPPTNRPRHPVARPPPPPTRPVPPHAPPPPPPSAAPPPPPHRPAPLKAFPPPPPGQTLSVAPPPPPTRNSSMRNGSSVSNISDLEARFSDSFHGIHEFPAPQPFTNCLKIYNSRTTAKQQAPQPPTHHQLQIAGASWAHNTSSC